MKKKVKGIDGWLLFFVIILTFIRPIVSFFDIIVNASFYSYASGAYDIASLVWVLGLTIWGIVVGISIWKLKNRAIIWAKELLIVEVVLGVAFVFLFPGVYTAEEQAILFSDVFRSIIAFTIWFSYLNLSKRVKNTFKQTKIELKRLGLVFLIVLGSLFLISLLSSIIPQDIETAGVSFSGFPMEFVESNTIEPEMANYHEFVNQEKVEDILLRYDSSLPSIVFLIKSEKDFDLFLRHEDFNMYEGCYEEDKQYGEIRCTVSTGGVVVWNFNQQEMDYTLSIS